MISDGAKPNIGGDDVARRLRHFGLDYLTLNIGVVSHHGIIPPSIAFLNALFSLSHNLTNASDYKNMVWGASSEEVNLLFSTYGNDEIIFVNRGEDTIMMIRQIGLTSNMPPFVKQRYQYHIQFYGWFFGLARLECLTLQDYWHPFLTDIEHKRIVSSISRIDICADIEFASVTSIERSIVRKGRMKARSKLEIDDKTGIPGTVCFGARALDWKARIYNKLAEIVAKHKESLYPDYVASKCITRLEIELHSKPCQEYKVTLHSCLNLEFVLGVYIRFLDKRSGRWRILRFITSELKKRGMKAIPAERFILDYDQISNRAYFKRTANQVKECAKRYGMPIDSILKGIETFLQLNANESPPTDPFLTLVRTRRAVALLLHQLPFPSL